jgi:Omp85 superfamily domain
VRWWLNAWRRRLLRYALGVATASLIIVTPLSAHGMRGTDSVRSAPVGSVRQNGFLALPVIFYKPETRIAVGGVGIYYFREEGSREETRASSIQAGFIYTQRGQIITKIEPQVFLNDEEFYLAGDISFFKYPDKFFGIGNATPDDAEEDYTPQILRFRANLQYQVMRHLFTGIRYNLIDYRILVYQQGKTLEKRTTLGSDGGFLSGLGMVVKWDTRDNVFFPTSGNALELSTLSFQKAFGSGFTYNVLTADLRQYLTVVDDQSLAVQLYGGFSNGNPPFQYMQRLGGEKLMRGYLEGRYLDKNYVTVQVEYRVPLWWRLGAVVFAGLGDVAPSVSAFKLKEFKTSKGFGLRYAVSREEKLNIRVDLGFGQNGNAGFYLTAAEAF